MFDLQSFILGLTVILNLFLGGFVVFKNFHSKTHLLFGTITLSVAAWVASMLIYRITDNYFTALLWLRLSYIAAGFIGITFFAFCLSFVKKKLSGILWSLIILMVGWMTVLLLQPWFLIRTVQFHDWGKSVIEIPSHHLIYSFYFIIFFFGALAIIGNTYRKASGQEKLRLGYIFWGVLLAGSLGTFLNLILPSPWLNEWRFTWLGPVFTLIFVVFIALAITKYHLMNIRVIAVELFTLAILIMAGFQIFLSENITKFLLNIILFLLLLIFGVLLIRSALNEVDRREKMERLSKELAAANEKLKELDRAKTDFLSIASHQLRSPLTVTKVGVSALLDGTFGQIKEEKQIYALKKIFESNERLINLVNDFLNISRIEMGKIEYNFVPTDIVALVKSVIEELKPKAEVEKLELIFSPPSEPLPLLKIDEGKIRQVLVNIMDNAIKYTEKGSVTCHLEKNGNKLLFAIKDTGQGLRPEDFQVIFEKFRRGGNGMARERVEGSGFGLFVAKTFIEAHGGKIWAESEGESKGSTFYFTLLCQ